MSANVLADEGVKLVQANKYVEGIEKLTKALRSHSAPLWLLERSKAYMRTKQFDLALQDAHKALSVAYKRANRDQIVEAQLRRAITLFRIGRFADADVCAFWAIRICDAAKASEDDGQQNKVDEKGDYTVTLKEVNEAHANANKAKKQDGLAAAMGGGRSKDDTLRNQAFSWRLQALTAMEKLEPGAPGRKITVVKYPSFSDSPDKTVEAKKAQEIENENEPEEEADKPKIPRQLLSPANPSSGSTIPTWDDIWKQFQAVHAKSDIRTDFYQTDSSLNISFFVKNVSKDSLVVDVEEQSVTLSPIPNIPLGSITLNLYDKIDPASTSCTVKSMKIELVLKKAVPGKWAILRQEGSSIFDNISIGQASHGTYEGFVARAKEAGYRDPGAFAIENFGGDTIAWYNDLRQKLSGNHVMGNSAAAKPPTPGSGSATDGNARQLKIASETTPAETTTTEGVEKEKVKPSAVPSDVPPAYPTSSKTGPKTWDKMDLDDDEDDESKTDADFFFKKLYKDADPDTRRAMMKSYVQSNGTSLSTSWAEASNKDYETNPPDSMESKSWDD